MKINKRRWLCGWLALCLLLGLVSVGLAEGEGIVVELPDAAEAGGDAIDLELDIGRTNVAPDGTLEDLTLDDTGLLLDMDENIPFAGGLAELDNLEALGSVSTLANDSDIEDFYIDENGVLCNYKGSDSDVVIPDGVTSISDNAFYYCENLTRVTIPTSVTSIGSLAFNGCVHLQAIDVTKGNPTYASHDGVLYTGDMGTLLMCPHGRTSVTIPKGVTSIGESSFYGCESLESVAISNTVTSIGKYAFQFCSSLASVTIPKSVTSIEYYAFAYCDGMTSVTIPEGVTSIGGHAFYLCKSLTSVTIPNSVTSMGSYAFSECFSLASLTIPNSMTSIVEGAFFCCESLTSVTIPDVVTSIGDYAFAGCAGLTSVTIPEGVTSIGSYAFGGCDGLTSITIPRSVTSIGYYAFVDCKNLTIYGYAGSYAESCAKRDKIPFVPIEEAVSLADAKITVADQVYTGKVLKPAVKVVLNGKTLKKGTDYTVSYKKNKAIGTATVTVTGKGKYTGSASASFKINPKTVKGLKLKSGQNSLTVSWSKSAGVSGYQLQYGMKKDFSSSKTITIAKVSTVSKTLKNLKKGKTYYVRIRAYKKVSGKIYYSAWSGAKNAKIK